ncbi:MULTISPECIES: hypothetical protein [unclassified Nocardioides]|uniref:hypothetical protein n=1 Tax=unclassified Nocardioides TaxID=2615069 RepID=UPI00070386D2|nr:MULTISPECIES: hypothetical protein [unclassified Nocardioides]KRC53187.1 hypothetical protein ASE19_12490 [Nocardioides sp. Root79]KRC72715.1 hypothetical protein ASE20_09015 [Nocardioides sp. Root240]
MPPVTPEQTPAPTPPEQTTAQWVLAAAHPRFLLELAAGYPVVLKQFVQLCLLLTYPGWLFFLAMYLPVWVVGKILYGVLWVLFWPLRASQKRDEPAP